MAPRQKATHRMSCAKCCTGVSQPMNNRKEMQIFDFSLTVAILCNKKHEKCSFCCQKATKSPKNAFFVAYSYFEIDCDSPFTKRRTLLLAPGNPPKAACAANPPQEALPYAPFQVPTESLSNTETWRFARLHVCGKRDLPYKAQTDSRLSGPAWLRTRPYRVVLLPPSFKSHWISSQIKKAGTGPALLICGKRDLNPHSCE